MALMIGIELAMGFVSLTVLLICLSRPGIDSRLQEDRMYANMCAQLVKRIAKLAPIYRKVTNEYATLVTKIVGLNPVLEYIAQEVPADIKQKAERDFCVQDSMKTEAVSLLQMQLTSMINQQTMTQQKGEVKDVE